MWDRTGIPLRTIQDIEREKFKLSLANAEKISAATGVSTDYLIANDPTHDITNTAGELWSEKDVKAIKQRAEEWPGLPEMLIRLRANFFGHMLSDYYILRRSLLATKDPLGALYSWQECRDKAWVEFLKEWPAAKWENSEAIKPADAPKWKEDFIAGKTAHSFPLNEGRDEAIETAKQDAEFVLAHPFEPKGSGPQHAREEEADFDILSAAVRGELRGSGDKIVDSFLETFRDPKFNYRQRSLTFDGYHDGAKMPPELVQELHDEIMYAMRERSTKPDEEAKNEGAPAKRRSPKKQR
jgi:hypothetical protein